MFSHVSLGTNDLEKAIEFYDQIMPLLGHTRESTGETFAGYGAKENIGTGINCLWIGAPFSKELANPGNGVNIALLANSRGTVEKVHTKALELGAENEGDPGIRADAHPEFYAAYFRDPDGNKLTIVCHVA